jgi:hypothetical protein
MFSKVIGFMSLTSPSVPIGWKMVIATFSKPASLSRIGKRGPMFGSPPRWLTNLQ